MANSDPPQKPAKDGLQSANEFLKFTLSLATEALVFNLDLAKEPYTTPNWSVLLVVLTWVALAIAIVGGILTMARIPTLLTEQDFDLEDSLLVWP